MTGKCVNRGNGYGLGLPCYTKLVVKKRLSNKVTSRTKKHERIKEKRKNNRILIIDLLTQSSSFRLTEVNCKGNSIEEPGKKCPL